jgi:hypothetical protein
VSFEHHGHLFSASFLPVHLILSGGAFLIPFVIDESEALVEQPDASHLPEVVEYVPQRMQIRLLCLTARFILGINVGLSLTFTHCVSVDSSSREEQFDPRHERSTRHVAIIVTVWLFLDWNHHICSSMVMVMCWNSMVVERFRWKG